ncbi:MAG: phosphoglycolate phosphatase [Methanosarcinales archaeon]|nr:phosphoglycolate phosphatase [Methanosarcinales archaeon]
MKIEAIAFDIDGTLTSANRSLDCRAVERIQHLDIPVILATGNVFCFANAAANLIGTTGIIIAENGGIITPGFGAETIMGGDRDECYRAYDALIGAGFDIEILDPELRKTEIALLRNFDADEASRYVSDFDVEIVDTKFAIHIKSNKVNKGTGLTTVSEKLGIGLEMIAAVGDSHNDTPMIQVVGFGGAVANSHPDLVAAADYVAKASYGGGVVEILDYLGL